MTELKGINSISPYNLNSNEHILCIIEELSDSESSDDKLSFPFSPYKSNLFDDSESYDNQMYFSSNITSNKTSDKTKKIFINKKNKYRIDNIIRKIKVHYINAFLIKFINIIITALKLRQSHTNFNLKFLPLRPNNLRKTARACINELKNKAIKDVIKTEISRKFKKSKNNHNVQLCKIIEEEEELKKINDILKLKFLYFFEKIYIQKMEKKKINLKEYDLFDLEIDLSEIELFEDLKLKNKNKENYDIYEMKMEQYKNIILNPKLKINIFKTRKYT